jgi:hypothetical protein
MAYNYHIRWKDPEDFPGTAFKNAERRCLVYSKMHEGVFSVFHDEPGSGWLFYTMRGFFSLTEKPIVSYQGGKKTYPIE